MWEKEIWESKDFVQLKQYLITLKDDKYREFHIRLVPGIDDKLPIIGIRLPALRKLGAAISKGNAKSFLAGAPSDYYEEIMLQGIVIGKLHCDFSEILDFITAFVPKINNWAICDSFVSGLTIVKKHREEFYAYINAYLHSHNEYMVRFAIISLMDYYTDSKYISELLKIYHSINHEGYYVKMAVAWGLSVAYIKEQEKTMDYLTTCNIDKWTYNKALQKIIESNRITKEDKDVIRKMKRK